MVAMKPLVFPGEYPLCGACVCVCVCVCGWVVWARSALLHHIFGKSPGCGASVVCVVLCCVVL